MSTNDNGSALEEADNTSETMVKLAQLMEIKRAVESNPAMFVSGWEEDDQDIEEKDMTDPVEQFLTAAEDGELDKLKRLFAENPDLLMAQDRDKYTALHRAAYNDRKEVCQWLLDKGANPEMRTADGWTPLHCAACWGNFEIVAILLRRGVDINSRTEGKIVPLHLAINSSKDDPHKQYMTVKYLLEAPGIEMNAVNKAGDTPLTLARRTRSQILELLESHMK